MRRFRKMKAVRFTVIYQGEDDVYGKVIICVRGKHDDNNGSFVPLEHPFEVMRRNATDSAWIPLKDRVVSREIVKLATTY